MSALGFNTRRHKRRGFDAVACVTAIQDGKPTGFPVRCEIADISDGGARLLVGQPQLVPDNGVLWLSANGSVRRSFRVVRRGSDHVGIRFL